MARKKRPQQQRNLPVPARQQPELSSLSTLAAKLLALAEEQRRALEQLFDRNDMPWPEYGEKWGLSMAETNRWPTTRDIAGAALATDLEGLLAEAKELGIDATTPAMAPETP